MATGWEWLVMKINQNEYKKVVELGVERGENAAKLLHFCPSIKEMTLVDLWEPQPGNDGPQDWTDWGHRHNHKKALQRIAPHKNRVDIRIFKDYTYNVAPQIPDGSQDLVFIDADHGYESCKRDVLDWLPKVRVGGILCGHDADWPTVRQAVNEVFGYQYNIIQHRGKDRIWYVEVDEGLLLHVKSSLEYHEVVGTINEEDDGDIGSVPKNGE